MIEKKVLNSRKIKEILKENYNIEVDKIKLITKGSAEIYKISSRKDYILKLYQTKYSKKEIDKEIDVINYLKRKKFIVPKYIKTLNNEYSVKIDNRYMILQEYISGKSKEKFMATKNEIKECGYIHGLLVKNLMNYSVEEVEEGNWYDFDKNIQKLNEIIKMGDNELVINDLNEKIDIMKNLKIDLSDIDKISYYVSHGDYSYLQFIYEEKKVKAIIDFIRVKKLPIVWEIMRSYSYMDKECKEGNINIDNLVLYVKEFMKSVPLNKYDLKYMPYVYMCQLLRSTYGYKEIYKKDNNDILEFAHFRTKLCKNIYENCEEISRKLCELI